jgi:hypothetical protein
LTGKGLSSPACGGPIPCERAGLAGGRKERNKDFFMDKDYINILVFHTTFGIRRLRIRKEKLRMVTYLLLFFQFSVTFFFCDYVQVRKKTFLLNQLRQQSQTQKSHIQLFSTKIEDLEKKLSKLKDIDQKIRIIANLERGPETLPFIGMGGSSFSVTRAKSVTREKSAETLPVEKPKRLESKAVEPKTEVPKVEKPITEEPREQKPKESELTEKGEVNAHPNELPAEITPEPQ